MFLGGLMTAKRLRVCFETLSITNQVQKGSTSAKIHSLQTWRKKEDHTRCTIPSRANNGRSPPPEDATRGVKQPSDPFMKRQSSTTPLSTPPTSIRGYERVATHEGVLVHTHGMTKDNLQHALNHQQLKNNNWTLAGDQGRRFTPLPPLPADTVRESRFMLRTPVFLFLPILGRNAHQCCSSPHN